MHFGELYKSAMLLEFALARLRLCSESTVRDDIRDSLHQHRATTTELLRNFGSFTLGFGLSPDRIELHLLKSLKLKIRQYQTTNPNIESVGGPEESLLAAQPIFTNTLPEDDISVDTSTATGHNNGRNDLRVEAAAL